MTLEKIIDNLADEFDLDDNYELREIIENLTSATNPDMEQYCELIDEWMDEEQTKLADLQDAIEPLRKFLLGVEDETEEDEE